MRAETNSLSVWACHALVAQAPSTTAWSPFLSEEGMRDLAFACAFGGCVAVSLVCGRPMVAPTANMVRRSVANLTSVKIQGVDAFGVSEIDLKHVPNR